jgi:hypothetical protein
MQANVLPDRVAPCRMLRKLVVLWPEEGFVIYTEAFQGTPRHGRATEVAEAMEGRDPTQLS